MLRTGDALLVAWWMRTVSEANAREHWGAKARRVAEQTDLVTSVLQAMTTWDDRRQVAEAAPGSEIEIVRLSPSRGLDSDNLAGALKAVRDTTARWLWGGAQGQHDGRTRWTYSQMQTRGIWAVALQLPLRAST